MIADSHDYLQLLNKIITIDKDDAGYSNKKPPQLRGTFIIWMG